jgi:hypothetical protein
MAVYRGPQIITDGLVFCYDEGDLLSKNKKELAYDSVAVLADPSYNYFARSTQLDTTAASIAQYNSTSPSPGTGFSGNIWIRRTGNTTGNWDSIFYMDGGGPRYRQIWFGWYLNTTDRIHCSMPYYSATDTTNWWSVDPSWSDAGLTFTINNWYNFSFSYNNSTRVLSTYINGKFALSDTRPGAGDINNPNGAVTYIFGLNGNSYVNSQTKLLSIYNRPLSSNEIVYNYNVFKTRFGI